MSRKVLVLSTSPRQGGNSDVLADEFAKGATEAGHDVEKISLHGKEISFCRGCMACRKTQKCVIRDDANLIAQKMLEAEVVAFATPIYFYAVCGQMKTMLDRTNPLFPADYAFRDIYLLTSAADEEETAIDGAIKEMEGWVSCFEKARLKGVLRGVGITDPGDARKAPAIMQGAYALGKNV